MAELESRGQVLTRGFLATRGPSLVTGQTVGIFDHWSSGGIFDHWSNGRQCALGRYPYLPAGAEPAALTMDAVIAAIEEVRLQRCFRATTIEGVCFSLCKRRRSPRGCGFAAVRP